MERNSIFQYSRKGKSFENDASLISNKTKKATWDLGYYEIFFQLAFEKFFCHFLSCSGRLTLEMYIYVLGAHTYEAYGIGNPFAILSQINGFKKYENVDFKLLKSLLVQSMRYLNVYRPCTYVVGTNRCRDLPLLEAITITLCVNFKEIACFTLWKWDDYPLDLTLTKMILYFKCSCEGRRIIL